MSPNELKKLRNELGLSVAQAARQVHVTPRTWNYWEAGQRSIPEGVVHLFCLLNELDIKKYLE